MWDLVLIDAAVADRAHVDLVDVLSQLAQGWSHSQARAQGQLWGSVALQRSMPFGCQQRHVQSQIAALTYSC